jgi:hypothetical protein
MSYLLYIAYEAPSQKLSQSSVKAPHLLANRISSRSDYNGIAVIKSFDSARKKNGWQRSSGELLKSVLK